MYHIDYSYLAIRLNWMHYYISKLPVWKYNKDNGECSAKLDAILRTVEEVHRSSETQTACVQVSLG